MIYIKLPFSTDAVLKRVEKWDPTLNNLNKSFKSYTFKKICIFRNTITIIKSKFINTYGNSGSAIIF